MLFQDNKNSPEKNLCLGEQVKIRRNYQEEVYNPSQD